MYSVPLPTDVCKCGHTRFRHTFLGGCAVKIKYGQKSRTCPCTGFKKRGRSQ